ncbi:NAD(P)-binding protein [Polychaeton citri CBS 116435]|uniref:NAD(P)-binding protein n=1 Tax=Polychaeton citri CBS 116435 TaxID=1314669 RepID=A0A9P4Q045_9PEZI|nr:NAD(P)-binding protein [Polychaeton citri CBS 116435]
MPYSSSPYQPYAERYVDGPASGPTAAEIVKDLGLEGKLQDKVILITGASAGLGHETARVLHTTGAKLYLTGRDLAKGQAVADGLVASNPSGQKPVLIGLDLDNLESVREAAKQFLDQEKRLDILVLNAGIMAVPEGRTVDGFETQLGTNYFGHFLLFHLIKSTLLASGTQESPSRVITLSSAGHKAGGVFFDDLDLSKQGYNPMVAYAQSKTATIHLANSIDRHYSASGIRAVSVHPGMIFETQLGRHMSQEELAGFAPMAPFARPLAQGAATTVWAALEPHFNKQGGVYLADAGVSSAATADEHFAGPGYAPHAFDEAAEEKLWKLSFGAVGLSDDGN